MGAGAAGRFVVAGGLRWPVTAAFHVLVGGAPAPRLTSMSLQSSTNCPGMRVVSSQGKVLVVGA